MVVDAPKRLNRGRPSIQSLPHAVGILALLVDVEPHRRNVNRTRHPEGTCPGPSPLSLVEAPADGVQVRPATRHLPSPIGHSDWVAAGRGENNSEQFGLRRTFPATDTRTDARPRV